MKKIKTKRNKYKGIERKDKKIKKKIIMIKKIAVLKQPKI
jgi:hypothetical protein